MSGDETAAQRSVDLELLREEALAAARGAYRPYSGLGVGAAATAVAPARDGAISAGDGQVRIVTGCNVENASYGLTNCGERTAVFRMVAEHGPGARIVACAIVGRDAAPCHPCGACRQVLNEFGCQRVIVEGPRPEAAGGTGTADAGIPEAGTADGDHMSVVKPGEPISIDFAEILPHAFGPDDLR